MRSAASRPAADRGVVAVEFALLLPVLLLLIFGMIDFGRALNAQITLNQAARVGSRLAAMGLPEVATRTRAAATGLHGVGVLILSCPPGAGPIASAEVQTSYSFSFVTPVGAVAALFGHPNFGSQLALTATSFMPCET